MSIDEKWLQGRIAKPGDYDALPVEDLLASLLDTLTREKAERDENIIRSWLPQSDLKETS